MSFNYKTAAAAAAWAGLVLVGAAVAGLSAAMPWLVISVVAFGPPLVLLLLSRDPLPTTSQDIQRAKR